MKKQNLWLASLSLLILCNGCGLLPKEASLSLGVVDGRNIWKNDLSHSLDIINIAVAIEDETGIPVSDRKMASFYSANGQDTEAEAFAFKATQQFTKVILNTFADLTASERDLFWMKVKPWFTNTILQLTEKSPTDMMVSSAYNGTLLAKGLLLKSEQEMVNMLMESGDDAAVDAYRRLQANRALLLRQFETPRNLRTLNIDSLQRVITKQERRLVKRSKTYGNFRPLDG